MSRAYSDLMSERNEKICKQSQWSQRTQSTIGVAMNHRLVIKEEDENEQSEGEEGVNEDGQS